jgi:anhydro-N-acetylmuramic acid kinase
MTLMRAIGLMSGTSMDGIDVALIETDGDATVIRGPAHEYAYDPAFRGRLAQCLVDAVDVVRRDERPFCLAELEIELTGRHADAVRKFLNENKLNASDIDIIGFHGQTVLHRPERGLTVQIGDGQRLADALGIPVVYDMRANDMVHGGQGAPLVPVYHQALAANAKRADGSVAFVNIGGISNITFLRGNYDPIAFDTGPGNALIDQWVMANAGVPYDDGGLIASEGVVDEAIVDSCLVMPFFKKRPPKSLDRNDFKPELVAGLELSDGARTLAALTARSILAAAEHLPEQPRLWIICGGGRKNRMIMADLESGAAKNGATVISAEEAELDGGAMEEEARAYLAVRSLKGLPLTFPETTGVKTPVTGGFLAKPRV